MEKLAASKGVYLRQYPRMPVEFPLIYHVDGSGVKKKGRARDIGGGGIHFESAEAIAPGSAMTISFALRAGVTVEVRGQLASFSSDPATGNHFHHVAFSGVSDGVRDSILKHIFEAWRADLAKVPVR